MVTINEKKIIWLLLKFTDLKTIFSGHNKIAQMIVAQFCRKIAFLINKS